MWENTAADVEKIATRYTLAPVRIDILTGVTGVEFTDAWTGRERRPFLGDSVWFIGRDHLVFFSE